MSGFALVSINKQVLYRTNEFFHQTDAYTPIRLPQHFIEREEYEQQINATSKHYETNPPENKRAVYRLLEQASEESRQRTRATQRNLEERLHENQSIYCRIERRRR